MKKLVKKCLGFILTVCMVIGLAACGGGSGENTSSVDTSEVAGDYYLDLTDLGMKLTLYLRLDEAGNFLFSNTLDFEVNKSSGTFQKSEDQYIMVYSSVNGEEKSVSDGLTSSFVVMEDGSLDFTTCDCIYYGSATASSTRPETPGAMLIGKIVPEDYEQPGLDSAFEAGVYTTEAVTENGVTYSHTVTFYEDNSYMHVTRYEENGQLAFDYEMGTYGVSTTQLALEPEEVEGADSSMSGRTESEIVDGSNLKLSLFASVGAAERTLLDFVKTDTVDTVASFSGTGSTNEGESFNVTVTLYADGSYEINAGGFVETGVMALDSSADYVKQYPDHPESSVRGLTQVATVPYGVLTEENGSLVLSGLRVRNSENLTRYECTVSK